MTYKHELQRKAFHQLGLIIPVTYLFSSQKFVLQALIPITLFVIIIDFSRIYFKPVGKLFQFIFGRIVRPHEATRLTGSTYFLLANVLVISFFSRDYAVFSLFILSISDASAALIGIKFGKHAVLNKSWEGTGAFFVTALLIGLLLPGISITPAQALLGAAAGALIELIPIPIDDNFRIPVGICILLKICFS